MRYSMCPRLKHNSKSTKFGFSEGHPQQTAVLGLSIHMPSTPFTLVRGISPKSIWVANRREKITPGYLLSCCLPLATHSFSERLLWSGAPQGAQNHNSLLKAKLQGCIFLDSWETKTLKLAKMAFILLPCGALCEENTAEGTGRGKIDIFSLVSGSVHYRNHIWGTYQHKMAESSSSNSMKGKRGIFYFFQKSGGSMLCSCLVFYLTRFLLLI